MDIIRAKHPELEIYDFHKEELGLSTGHFNTFRAVRSMRLGKLHMLLDGGNKERINNFGKETSS